MKKIVNNLVIFFESTNSFIIHSPKDYTTQIIIDCITPCGISVGFDQNSELITFLYDFNYRS